MGVCRTLGLASAKASGNGLGHKTCNLVMKRYETDLIVPIDHCRLIIVFAHWAVGRRSKVDLALQDLDMYIDGMIY